MPARDHIEMPAFEAFRDAASYVAILSHELTRWTAPPHRLWDDFNRARRSPTEAV
ncbi:MAG: zincin-like metallopeptidase domain-containing protein [Rhizobium sp.]|uniref:zincin-like metallopeptidase domain-containing protein n=1 Tax=Rhizobium sp. TaxID=391 RepID=UPI0030F1557B